MLPAGNILCTITQRHPAMNPKRGTQRPCLLVVVVAVGYIGSGGFTALWDTGALLNHPLCQVAKEESNKVSTHHRYRSAVDRRLKREETAGRLSVYCKIGVH